jgi:pectate lyase/pectin methylesterase-like acyl-CoA thioesterase
MKTTTPNRSILLVKPLNLLATGFFLPLLLFCAASPASAAITFDSSSSSAVAVGARSITWRHTIGSGPDRALVVAVAIDDFIIFNGDVATVKFNNVVMHAAANSHAMSPGLRILETQIFYLTGDELPPAGSYEVSVSFTRKVDVAAGGAVSLFGVQPGAPVVAATNVKPLSLGPIRTTINAPADSWVVDLVASEINASPTPGPGQVKRFSAARNLFGIAGSAQGVTTPGPTTLVWNNGLSRLVTSAVAFAARPEFRLTLATNGSGTIQSDPAGDKFPAGTRVTLTATPAPGWRFEGWSGDLTGTDNPAMITMDREKSITANFTPLPPSITTQPVSQSVTTGSNVTFMVAASGEPPLTYQWKKNGAEIAGATTDTLALMNVQLSDAGIYTVTVSNAGGSVESAPATLSVTSAAGLTIMNDSFADGERLTFAPPASATWLKAQSSTAATVAPGSARFTWNTTSADMISGFFTSSGSPVTLGVGDTLNLSVTFSFTGLNPDAIAAPSPGLRFGILDSKGSRPADNGGTSNAVYIGDTGYGLFTSISTAGATSGSAFTLNRRTTLTSNNIFNTGADFTTIGAGGGPARAFADNTDYTLTYSITRLSATQTRLAASITGGALGDTYNFSTTETSATPETTFDYFGWRVGSSNFAASITFKNLSVTLGLTPPVITMQPLGKTTIEGDNIGLPAAAAGSAPLTFQWSKNGVPIAGATSPILMLNNVRVADSGSYVFTATNPAGIVASDVATVVVNLAPPFITMQPRSQTILVGEPVTFTVAAGGSAPLTYQWRKNGDNIAGATSPSFSIASLQFGDAGVYTAVVSNGAGSVTSDPATLVVSATPVPPSIITQPMSITVVAGAQAQFTVTAEGSSPLSFQWRKDGAAIPGATGATYTIAGASADDAGSYTVTVTNAAGSVTSDPATLTVITPPSIVTPPAPQTVNAGATATFTVVASGTQPLTYQWRKNGANIPSATTDTLTLNNVQASDAAAYSVVVSNAAGSVTSPAATLTVVDPALTVTALFPKNDATGLPVDAPLKITFSVAPTLGASGLIQIHDAAIGEVIDTIDLAAAVQMKMIGGTPYNYLPVIVSGNTALITPHVSLAYNKTYFVTIDTGVFRTANGVFAGISGDTVWRFATKPAAPDAGATTLVVAADGSGDFATVQGAIDFVPASNTVRRIIFVRKGVYQELVRINGDKPLITLRGEDRKETVIAYANNANFNPNSRSVVWVNAGDWTVENLTVRNLTPQGGSQAETIRTSAVRSQIRNCDLYSFQDTLQLNGSAYVENCYIEGDVDFMWGNAAAYFLNCELKNVRTGGFYVQARTPQNQPGFIYVNCRLSGAAGVTGDFLARIDPNVFPDSQVVYINSAMGPQVAPAGWRLDNATSSNTVRFWEYRSTDLNGAPLDVSQRIASSRQISDAEATQWSDTNFVLGGWAPQTPPFIRSQPLSQTASAGQDVTFAVGASAVPAPAYQWFKDGAPIPGATGPALLLPAVQASAAGNYTVTVSNSVGSTTSATATLTVVAEAGAPMITQQPQIQTAVIGGAATFTVSATGAEPLAYQWLKDGAPIAGATSPTLTRTALQLSDAGFYSVTIGNGIGSTTSAPVLLTVRATPIVTPVTIVTQPVSRTAFVGDAVSFSVIAQGVPPPSYQWFKDGAPIAGATAATLTLTNVQLNSAGSYSVTVTNVAGSVTSNPATLTVFTRGNLITQQPQSQVVNIGETATFTVLANGAGAISYQWRKNGVDIAGATDSALTLPNVQPTDTAVYTVLVVSGTEAALSAPAILAVTSAATGLPPLATFALEGFASMGGLGGQGVTGGGLADPSDTARYKIIDSSTPNPAQTLQSYLQSPDPLIIELRADVDLGALNNQNRRPLINPELIASNLGVIRVASNKTLFSDRGATLRHGTLNIDGSQNIIIRNLKFRGLWEWDDATQGAYDLQGWEFIALTNGAHNVWIDHCDFAKVYDGQVDIVRGSDLVTVSYCRFTGDLGDEAANQINYLESLYQANPADSRISYYASLRNAGQPVQQIITHEIPQDKTSLVGNDDNAGATDAGRLNVTYHHNAFTLVRQRTPRMRFGNAHVYNIFVDDTLSAPFPGTQTAVNSTINAAVLVENSDFLEVQTPLMFSGGGRITQRGGQWTRNGALTPFDPTRLNPVDPDALVWNPPASFTWTDLTRLPYPYALSPVDFVRNNPNQIGAITPADDTDRALLRGYLPLTSLLAMETPTPPGITTQPASQTAQAGSNVTFSVVASGTAPLSYQWRKDGADIPGANSATLTLTNVQLSEAGSYSVEVSNNEGVGASDPATLTVTVAPVFFLRERFADGDRTTQNLPDSAAWFTSSGSNNLTATVGQATQIVSSSRTLLAYFTNASATPVNLGVNQTLTLDFTVQFTGFDTAAALGANTFVVGLLRSVANPDATSGTGFTPTVPPNTNARVSGDFGSNNPPSNVFNNYGGYAAMTYTGVSGTGAPVRLYARTGLSASLLNSTGPFTQFTGAAPTPSTAMTANTDYRGTLTLQNTGSGVNVSYTLRDAATGNVVMTYSATQAAASFTQFDTVAFYLSKASASANYNFIIEAVDVSLSGGSPGDPPVITTQPVSQTVSAGANVTFTVGADGATPLSYQWLKNGAAMAGATAASLTLTNVQAADAGAYRVVVSNAAGSATSATAVLTVETGPVAPSITSQPASQIVVVGGQAGFTVIATGTAPLSYQWSKNGSPIAGATAATLNLTNVQQSDSGDYSVTVSNSVGTATSNTATLTVSDAPPTALYDLVGFARAATGGGLPPESDPNYRKVFTADDLVAALGNRNTKVIEIMNDLDLGFNEVPATARTGALRSASAPLLHPALLTTGVSLIDIQDKNGLTIFSANGATIRHANFNVKRANNVIIRNLKFDELWEWDESSKGKYDKQGWDFITVDMTSDNIWIDHCTFTKAYDGVIDIKGGTRNITISWCSFLGDDGGPGSFVRRQIEALDQNRPAYPMYDFLRSNGFSVEDIIAISRSQKKGHLVGANELDPANANHQVTLHHNYYLNMQDRLPRLRAGNAHAYDIYVNNAEAFAAKGMRDAIVAAMTPSNAAKLNGSNATYSFDVVLNGAISTEGGAVLLEKSQLIGVIFPLRNNQKDASLTQYTGKILALDTLYQLGGLVFRGDSNTPDSPLAPVPAPELAFSWNGFATLPYVYTTHDPTQLPLLLTGTEGAGSGRLIWTKENWLKTSY